MKIKEWLQKALIMVLFVGIFSAPVQVAAEVIPEEIDVQGNCIIDQRIELSKNSAYYEFDGDTTFTLQNNARVTLTVTPLMTEAGELVRAKVVMRDSDSRSLLELPLDFRTIL